MTARTTVSREQWLAARLELLEAEKELNRRSDEVARQRQQLPWVPVEKDYRFETEDGGGVIGRPVRRALAVAGVPLHVRTRVQGRVVRRARRSPTASTAPTSTWRTTTSRSGRRVARPDRRSSEAYKRRMGWRLPLGLFAGQRLQLRLQHAFTEDQQASGTIDYN